MMAATADNAGMTAGRGEPPIVRSVHWSARGLLRRMEAWIAAVPGEGCPEVHQKLLHTLQESRFLLLLSLFWTETGLLLAFLATHAFWPFALCCMDFPLAAFRFWLHQRNTRAIRAGQRFSSMQVIASSIAWCVIIAFEILGLLLVADLATTVIAVILGVGFQGYAASRFAAFPRMALLLLGGVGCVFSAGLAGSPFRPLHWVAALVPLVVIAYATIMYTVHGILLTAFRAQQQYRLLSLHDALTGLANRKLMRDKLTELCVEASRPGGCFRFAVFCIDLDRFKTINDRFGHAEGDRLLIRVGELLRSLVRAQDMVCRIGGDEFVVLMPGADHERAFLLAERLSRAARLVCEAEGQAPVWTTLSIGIALCSGRGAEPDMLLAQADEALYEVKRSGKGMFRMSFYKEPVPVPDRAAPSRKERQDAVLSQSGSSGAMDKGFRRESA